MSFLSSRKNASLAKRIIDSSLLSRLKRWSRIVLPLFALLSLSHWLWQPGLELSDGHHDRNHNALWLEHGWLGDDAWFRQNQRQSQKSHFRTVSALKNLVHRCHENGVIDLYPHLCPTQNGEVAGVDHAQVERLLTQSPGLRVLPWVGGRLDGDFEVKSAPWRTRFVASVARLLHRHPRLAGIHLNIEPWRSGNAEALLLLDELRAALPNKTLSVSAYPPFDWYWPFKSGWSRSYFRNVATRCDQMTVMAYDSSIHDSKFFQWSVSQWTYKTLDWTASLPHPPQLLVGVPTYADAGTWWGSLYHNGRVESLDNSLIGIHRGLSWFKKVPPHFQGVAVYSSWKTDENEWKEFRSRWSSQPSSVARDQN